jgi:hypothetical protein
MRQPRLLATPSLPPANSNPLYLLRSAGLLAYVHSPQTSGAAVAAVAPYAVPNVTVVQPPAANVCGGGTATFGVAVSAPGADFIAVSDPTACTASMGGLRCSVGSTTRVDVTAYYGGGEAVTQPGPRLPRAGPLDFWCSQPCRTSECMPTRSPRPPPRCSQNVHDFPGRLGANGDVQLLWRGHLTVAQPGCVALAVSSAVAGA